MDKNIFNQKYSAISEMIMNKFDRNTGAFMLNQDTVRLLELFCNNGGSTGKTLIPSLSLGELSLCAEEWIGYTANTQAKEVLQSINLNANNSVIEEDFLIAETDDRYKSIVVFPPFGVRTEHGRSEVAYIEKALGLLEEGGRMVALVPQNITTATAFKTLREKILAEYSLDAVITVKRIGLVTSTECSLLVVDNKNQSQSIYMSLGGQDADEIYNAYLNGSDGFYVNSEDVYDRIDANYFDPKYKEVRDLIQNRDTVKLGDIADIFTGLMIPAPERRDNGDYLIIKPQYIFDREVHLGNERKVFCTRDFLLADRRGERCILKNGDVLISMVGRINWAIYSGDEDFAVANQNVAVIRGRSNSEEWLKLFFSTRTGIDYLESQLRFFSHCGVFNHISIRSLCDMAVPDLKMMKVANNMRSGMDLEAKVAALFGDLGWDVREEYSSGRYRYDMALFFNNEMKGVVEVKSYKAKQIQKNLQIARQLSLIKENVGNASVFLFVDDDIYEYVEGNLEQLAELPRPERKETIRKSENKDKKRLGEGLQIEKRSIEETSLTDRMLLEMATGFENIMTSLNRIEGKVDDIADKIEALSKQISGYQSLVDKQLDMAVSPEEEERIIHAFSEECAERIIGEVDARGINREYNTELQKLILSFGESAWNKMEESSRTFLVSSKVIFNNLIGLQDIVDYSGVCLLVTKALEVEMGKRFCRDFLAFLKQKYPGKANHAQFPTVLLDRYGKPIKPKHFTLGSVAYVLCHLKANDLTEEQDANNREKLLEYTREKLFAGKTNDEIMKILDDYAESVEEVKNDYRNPSAHTNELRKVDAEQCFALVLDVEKLMKRMLDSFDQ